MVAATFQPLLAKYSTVARPIPDEAPVIRRFFVAMNENCQMFFLSELCYNPACLIHNWSL
jgi:hypothetical protein